MERSVISRGDRFGLLTVKHELVGRGKRKWACQCDCGNEVEAEETKLRCGHKRSCGCLRSKGSHLLRMTSAATIANYRPIVGQRFGRLVILSQEGNNLATCRCDCGNIVVRKRNSIIGGYTKSCGCLRSERAKKSLDERVRRHRLRAGRDENTPMSPETLVLRNRFAALSASIRRIDDYTCALCRKRGVKLNVHHIERWSDSPSLRFDESNLVTLCRECHIEKAHGGNFHAAPNAAIASLLKLYVSARSECGQEHDRDVNAALNILARHGHVSPAVGVSGQ